MISKSDLRLQLKTAINALSAEEKRRQSQALCQRLLNHPQIQAASTLGIYLALPDEPELKSALQNLLQQGKTLALPFPSNDGWHYHHISSLEGEPTGPWNLTTPQPGDRIDIDSLQAVLVPGRGFTPQGDRIGRGKGIYDQLLKHFTGPRMGIAFSCQLCDSLPTEAHDIPLTDVWFAPHHQEQHETI